MLGRTEQRGRRAITRASRSKGQISIQCRSGDLECLADIYDAQALALVHDLRHVDQGDLGIEGVFPTCAPSGPCSGESCQSALWKVTDYVWRPFGNGPRLSCASWSSTCSPSSSNRQGGLPCSRPACPSSPTTPIVPLLPNRRMRNGPPALAQRAYNEKGDRWVERILSVRETCRLRGIPTFPVLVEAVTCFFNSQHPNVSWI